MKLNDAKPVYPSLARQRQLTGVVLIEVTLDTGGKVRDARVRSIPLLDDAALDAVRKWEFAPTMIGGRRVPVIMTVAVNVAPES